MLLNIVIIIQILFIKTNADSPSLTISRSKSHIDKSGNYTPLVVSLSTEDKSEKVKPVDLICIVDVSGSMSGEPINLVKESLKYLVKLMNETDNFALVTFSSSSQIVNDLTKMTEENKSIILDNIENLNAGGGTNIYSGLEEGLYLLKNDYSSGERIASMILLSDGDDNYYYDRVVSMFEDLIEREGKKDYVFTLNTFGYGSYYDYSLMNNIALIRDGAFFNIDKLADVNDAFLKIYGSLSTVSNVNVQLKIQSNFNITKVYGIEDMYDANITSDTLSSFNVKLIQVIYGKKYDFILLVDVPKDTPNGTEVLNATVSSLGLSAKYLWDEKYSQPAYEEYIRCIVVIIFIEGYNTGYYGIPILEEGIKWIKTNYNGTEIG
jgi:Mg-chelatase subunit ChlD